MSSPEDAAGQLAAIHAELDGWQERVAAFNAAMAEQGIDAYAEIKLTLTLPGGRRGAERPPAPSGHAE